QARRGGPRRGYRTTGRGGCGKKCAAKASYRLKPAPNRGGGQVQRASLISVAPIAVAALLAGCGGSGKSTSTAASSHPASAPSQTPSGPAGTPAVASTAAVVLTSKPNKLGTILGAGPKRLTVYLYEADKASRSSSA